VASSGGGPPRVPVLINARVWEEEVERLAKGSRARVSAERERRGLERHGIELTNLSRCDAAGPDGTKLTGLLKTYVPVNAEGASARPFGFVFAPARGEDGPHLELVAYGERHPRKGTRSVYERAHKRLHGRYPDQ
jgi:hypothetical protein